jgi:hypothetical protein
MYVGPPFAMHENEVSALIKNIFRLNMAGMVRCSAWRKHSFGNQNKLERQAVNFGGKTIIKFLKRFCCKHSE